MYLLLAYTRYTPYNARHARPARHLVAVANDGQLGLPIVSESIDFSDSFESQDEKSIQEKIAL